MGDCFTSLTQTIFLRQCFSKGSTPQYRSRCMLTLFYKYCYFQSKFLSDGYLFAGIVLFTSVSVILMTVWTSIDELTSHFRSIILPLSKFESSVSTLLKTGCTANTFLGVGPTLAMPPPTGCYVTPPGVYYTHYLWCLETPPF